MIPRLLAALAALAVAPTAGAYVRSTDPDTGACLYWAPRSVQYRINPTRAGTSPTCGPLSATDSGAANAVRAGFAAWGAATLSGASQACTDLTLVEGPVTSAVKIGYAQGGANENLIVFRNGWCSQMLPPTEPCMTNPAVRCSDTFGCFENTGSLGGTRIIALTTTTYASSTGEIVDADMEFVDWTGVSGPIPAPTPDQEQGWYFTCFEPAGEGPCGAYGAADCTGMDIQNTATHEAGHFIGLAHVGVAGATMQPTAAIGETSKRSLADDDVSGVCAIYPRGGPTSVCVEQSNEDEGGCGCGSGGGSAAGLLALLGWLLVSRGRPSRA